MRESDTNTRTISGKSEDFRIRIKFFRGSAIFIILSGIVIFASSGRIDWVLAWIFLGVSLAGILINSLTLSPSLLKERMKNPNKDGIKKWDSMLLPIIMLLWFYGSPFVAGLDMRFGWSGQVPLLIPAAAIALYILADALTRWAMANNSFFDTVVRIQGDRHTVARGGPYRYVRHPGYLGMLISILTIPLMLGSYWALAPAIGGAALLMVRTGLEDKTLQEELAGYKEYAQQIRYRLIPGVW